MSTLSKGNDTADVPLTFSSTVRNLSTTGPSSLTATVGGTALEEEQQQNWNKSQDSSTQTTRVNYSLKSFSLSLTSGFTVWIANCRRWQLSGNTHLFSRVLLAISGEEREHI